MISHNVIGRRACPGSSHKPPSRKLLARTDKTQGGLQALRQVELALHLWSGKQSGRTTSWTTLLVSRDEMQTSHWSRAISKTFPDSSTQIVMAIWPNSSPMCPEVSRNSTLLSLRKFVQETLKRSRTSYSTLQVALYYLVLIKDKLPASDFTMEQTDDCPSSRALQCGRRMFLAALILASKYLQDRNYSARAWSKISGLDASEINRNEMAFVVAVDWKLHITEEVYHRWTDCVMNHSPSKPPTPPSSSLSRSANKEYEVELAMFSRQCDFFQKIIRRLNPDLENLEDAVARSRGYRAPSSSPRLLSPRSVLAAAQDESGDFPFGSSDFGSRDATPTPTITRTIMEPYLSSAQSVTRLDPPSLGLLPTPRLTPQVSVVSDPWPIQNGMCGGGAYGSRGGAMGMAVNAAGPVQQDMILDKWPSSMTSSPMTYHARRPSYAASVSTTSSPESMVSDLSGSSRSSSISSTSSLTSAPYTKMDHSNLEVQARCRSAKQLVRGRYAMGPTIPSMVDDATKEAAQVLQSLHIRKPATSAPKAGSKRSRPLSMDLSLQDNVRDLLRSDYTTSAAPAAFSTETACLNEGRKRVCCSPEKATQYQISAMEYHGPGMWDGILN